MYVHVTSIMERTNTNINGGEHTPVNKKKIELLMASYVYCCVCINRHAFHRKGVNPGGHDLRKVRVCVTGDTAGLIGMYLTGDALACTLTALVQRGKRLGKKHRVTRTCTRGGACCQ